MNYTDCTCGPWVGLGKDCPAHKTGIHAKELTPWFPRGTYPVRKGYYISSAVEGVAFYRYWDGKTWYYGGDTLEQAVVEYTRYRQKWPWPLTWRGLTKKP